MALTLTHDERTALEGAQQGSQQVRHWRRYQAVLLRADGVPVAVVARTLGCTETSVYNWTAAWRQEGLAGVVEGPHPGAQRRLDAQADAAVEALLTEGDPQAHGSAATGWTVPLLRTELAKQGWRAAERTIRRTRHRLGWRWKRPKDVLGRPDPAYAEKKSRRPAGGSRRGGWRGGAGSAMRRRCASSRRGARAGRGAGSSRSSSSRAATAAAWCMAPSTPPPASWSRSCASAAVRPTAPPSWRPWASCAPTCPSGWSGTTPHRTTPNGCKRLRRRPTSPSPFSRSAPPS